MTVFTALVIYPTIHAAGIFNTIQLIFKLRKIGGKWQRATCGLLSSVWDGAPCCEYSSAASTLYTEISLKTLTTFLLTSWRFPAFLHWKHFQLIKLSLSIKTKYVIYIYIFFILYPLTKTSIIYIYIDNNHNTNANCFFYLYMCFC